MHPNCEVVCSCDDRAAWLVERRKGLGSSDAAAILGISPFKSALAVYVEKTTETQDKEETEAMKWGTLLEPLIAADFARETEREVTRSNVLLRSTVHPWQLATLDAVQRKASGSDGILEIKATGWRMGDWREGIPDHVMAQAQHQLAVTGDDWGSVAVLERGCKLLWKDFERNDRFIDDVLLPAESEFWRRVVENEPVQPDGSPSARAALKALYPSANAGDVVALGGEFIDVDRELVELKEQVRARLDRIETMEQRLVFAIGEAEVGALLNGVEYTYRLQDRKSFVMPASSFRVLRRREPKGK